MARTLGCPLSWMSIATEPLTFGRERTVNLTTMGDSIQRLYDAVFLARDADPDRSRTAKLFRGGRSKIAKKLAEEAIEVSIDAVCGTADAVTRESADLLYNLVVVWVAAGVRPEDVWAEMSRREEMLGLAEKLPKMARKERRKSHASSRGRTVIPLAPGRARGPA